MSDREDENTRNAISKLKALLAHKESILSRPPITKNSRGMPCKESQGSRIRLHEECQQLRERIADLEVGQLRVQYRRCIDPATRDVVTQAVIEKQFAERGIYFQNPYLTREAELVGSPSEAHEQVFEIPSNDSRRLAAALEKVFPNKTDAAIARYFAVVPKKNVRSIFKEIDRQRDRSDRPGTTDTTWIELPVLAERKNYDSFTDWLKEDENSAYPYVSRLKRLFRDRIKIITPNTTSVR